MFCPDWAFTTLAETLTGNVKSLISGKITGIYSEDFDEVENVSSEVRKLTGSKLRASCKLFQQFALLISSYLKSDFHTNQQA